METILTAKPPAQVPDAPGAPTATVTDVPQRIIDELGDAIGELRCAGSERLVRAGVSMSHLHVMWMMQRHGELSMTRLADMLDVSLSNATGLVDRMEERGLIERSRVPGDRRVVRVGLSDHGRDLLAQVDLVRSDLTTTILRRLTATQLDRLLRTVADLRSAVQAAREAGELPAHDDEAGRHSHRHPVRL
ncbi:MAG: MarR family winged helix-turn-helix transcriptional regulator [Candidatus Limnocylindrales bacterium]